MNETTPQTPAAQGPWWRRYRPEIVAGQVILAGFLLLASMQVIARYAFNAPFTWTEELSAALLIWMTFLGAAGVMRGEGHVKVELFEELLGPRVTMMFEVLWDLVIIGFLLLLIVGGWQAYGEMTFERTPALRMPLAWVVVIVPISAVLMAVYSALSVVKKLRHLSGGGGK